MSVARGLERRLERLVDGIAVRVFGGKVQPVELGTRLLREADLGLVEGPAGPTAPNVYVIATDVDTSDSAALEEVKSELAALVTDAAIEEGWRIEGPVLIAFGVGTQGRAVNIDTGFDPGPLPPWALLLGTEDHSRLVVRHNRTVVGRSRAADISIAVDSVSRRHALLWREGGRAWLADLGSANGTYLNGEPLSDAVEILSADVLTLADTSFVFRTV